MSKIRELIPLSASRIKVFKDCSWLYFVKYVLKLPDTTNSGALRGSCCHTIFECLLKPRHKKHFDSIIKKNNIKGSKVVNRYIVKYCKKNQLVEDDYNQINDMVLVGLKNDFFCKGGKILEPELKFDIINEKPNYRILGFMDKPAEYKDRIEIFDYKSSKKQFEGEDLEINIQAMMYSLASKHLFPKLKPFINFLFLKFPEDPIQKLHFQESELKGFEHQLEEISNHLQDFGFDKAVENFAAKDPKKTWLCGFAKKSGELKKDGNPKWHCPYKFPFEYYALCNDKNEVIKTSKLNDFSPDETKGEYVLKKKYKGCFYWNKQSYE